MKKYSLTLTSIALFLLIAGCQSKSDESTQKAASHLCANCGMNTAVAPKWEQRIEMQDGTIHYYCGPRCMFKHVLDGQVKMENIHKVSVNEYYELKAVDGLKAWYVTGSDILGPMGNELVPFATENAAAEFKRDHHGEEIVQWNEVNQEMIRELIGMQKMK